MGATGGGKSVLIFSFFSLFDVHATAKASIGIYKVLFIFPGF
jgi:hypothetical protein